MIGELRVCLQLLQRNQVGLSKFPLLARTVCMFEDEIFVEMLRRTIGNDSKRLEKIKESLKQTVTADKSGVNKDVNKDQMMRWALAVISIGTLFFASPYLEEYLRNKWSK